MTHARTVVAETGRFVELRRRLLTLHPDLEDQVLLDTLEGASALPEALEALIGFAFDCLGAGGRGDGQQPEDTN